MKIAITTTRFIQGMFVVLTGLVSVMPVAAQDRLDPVAVGKARASVASARGLGAIASNPGAIDLALTHPTSLGQDLTFSVYNVGGTIGSTYLSSSDFEQIFGRTVGWPSQEDRRKLGELLQDERLFINGANNLVTARYRTEDGGSFGLHYGHRLFGRLNFPEDFTRVVARGELLSERYRFINRGIAGSWVTELGLTYGKSIGDFRSPGWFPTVGLGATVKLLQGVGHFEVSDNSIITVDQKTIEGTRSYVIQGGFSVRSAQPDKFDPADAVSEFEAALFPSTSGLGIGGDIGVSGVLYRMAPSTSTGGPRDAIFFGMALQNVGRITWSRNTYLRSEANINDTLKNAALGNEQFEEYQGSLARTGEFATAVPSVFRAGLAVNVGAYAPDLDGTLIVDIEGEVPLNNVPGNSLDPRLAIGGDWGMNDWLSLRAGLNGGGISGFGIGLGVGLRPLDWLSIDVGTAELNGFFSGERVDLAFRVAAGL